MAYRCLQQIACTYIGSQALIFSDHYCQSTCRSVILSFRPFVRSFFIMHLFGQFLSDVDEILTQCSSAWCVCMVFTDCWSGPYDVIAESEPNRLSACGTDTDRLRQHHAFSRTPVRRYTRHKLNIFGRSLLLNRSTWIQLLWPSICDPAYDRLL